jgi:Putative beta-lactamase-inhibitor-like, PepSY-like
MYKVLSAFGLVVVMALAASALARADDGEEKVPIDKLPKAVTDALKEKFPKAELVEAVKVTEDGEVTYEVTVKHKKQELDVTLTPEGKIVQVEKEIEVKAVPKAVIDAVKKKYPKATIQGASEISKDDKVAEYELDIVTKDKKNLYVTFDKEGKFIYEEEVEDQPKDKKDDAKDKKGK